MRKIMLAVLVLLGAAWIPGEAAAQSCPGNLIAVKEIPRSFPHTGRLGELQLYYNPATGKNCARTVHGASTWGVPLDTHVYLKTCKRENRTPTGYCPANAPSARNQGNFPHQAGPVSLNGSGRCVDVQGGIARPGDGVIVVQQIRGHCR